MTTNYLVKSNNQTYSIFFRDDDDEDIVVDDVPSYKTALVYAMLMNQAYERGQQDVLVNSCWWPSLDQRLEELAEGFGEPDEFS